jgi:signal transduction histidine kinase
VDQLLIISRLDAGQAGMERERVNLAELATSTAEQMRLLADEKKIAMRFSVEPTVNVAGDRLRLKQVLVNLLDNAIKYTGETGTIELIVREESGRALLGVADNGIGIASAEQPYVFDRFYRTDKARTRATGGAGLGLSIVKAIVVAHEGRVSVASVEGKGTTLWVELPMCANVVEPRVAEIEGRRDAEHMAGLRELRAGTKSS